MKDKGELDLPEAFVFETGANRWRQFDHWPPRELEEKNLYFHADRRLSFQTPADASTTYDEYVSDPAAPVPFTTDITIGTFTPSNGATELWCKFKAPGFPL